MPNVTTLKSVKWGREKSRGNDMTS